jgi:hypothetical protein
MFITFYLLISLGKTILCLTALLMDPVRAVECESIVLNFIYDCDIEIHFHIQATVLIFLWKVQTRPYLIL